MVKHRRHFTSEDKVKALRRHLVEKTPVSDLCEELGIQPTQFYRAACLCQKLPQA